MKRTISIFFTVCFAVVSIFAQQVSNNAAAEKQVRAAVAKLKKSAYETDFSLVYYDVATEDNNVSMGHIVLDGRRFHLTLGDMESFYDGLTQWIYLKDDNEVTITEPGEDELKDNNPVAMMEYYVDNYRINFDSDEEKGMRIINFFPHNPKEAECFKIMLKLNADTGLPVSITIFQRNGDKISLYWNAFKSVVPDGVMFAFDSAKYKGVIINDLR